MSDYNYGDQQQWFTAATKALNETGVIPYEMWDKMHDGLKNLLTAARVEVGPPPVNDIDIPAGSLILRDSSVYVVAFTGRKSIMLIDPAYGTRYSDATLEAEPMADGHLGLKLSTLMKTYLNFKGFSVQLRERGINRNFPASVRLNIKQDELIHIDSRYEILRRDA